MKISLLKSLAGVSSELKSQMLAPSLEALSEVKASNSGDLLSASSHHDYASLLVSALDVSAVKELNDSSSSLWSTFLKLISMAILEGANLPYFFMLQSFRNCLLVFCRRYARSATCIDQLAPKRCLCEAQYGTQSRIVLPPT